MGHPRQEWGDGGRGGRWLLLARPPRVPAQARLERAAPLHNGRMSQAGQLMRQGCGQGRRATTPVSFTSVTHGWLHDHQPMCCVPERPS
jgi:hypothetical protein